MSALAEAAGTGFWRLMVLAVMLAVAPRGAEPTPGAEAPQPEMVLIPSGWFLLGSDHWDSDEGPAQRVYLPAYYIARTEVTHRQYRAFDPTHQFPPGEEDHPVANVTWAEAEAYARWAGKRLPTEWEWEKAARGTDGRRYPWGDDLEPAWANTGAAGLGGTAPVGFFPRDVSPFGVMDTVGNVAEWTASWYLPYSGGGTTNPDFGESFRVVRGTSWDGDFDCDGRTAFRNFARPDFRHPTIGFRLAQDATPLRRPTGKGVRVFGCSGVRAFAGDETELARRSVRAVGTSRCASAAVWLRSAS